MNSSPAQLEQVLRASLPEAERIWIGGLAERLKKQVNSLLLSVLRPPVGPLDAAILTPQTTDEAVYFADKLHSRLAGSKGAGVLAVIIAAAPSDHAVVDELTAMLTGVGYSKTAVHPIANDLVLIRFLPVRPLVPIEPSSGPNPA